MRQKAMTPQKTWTKPELVELDFSGGTNANIAIVGANDGTQDCQS